MLPTHEARARFPAAERVSLPDHIVMPGLVNLHTHAAMTLLRGLADDLPLMAWLNHHIWPAEGKHASARFVHDGTLIACAEMIRGGVTCFNDMYFYPEAAAQAALKQGCERRWGSSSSNSPPPTHPIRKTTWQRALPRATNSSTSRFSPSAWHRTLRTP